MKNQKGVALMMIMTAMMILMALWGEFTFESKISRIRANHMLDKTQARMLAETGLDLTMNRMRLFKEAFNTWSKNETTKETISLKVINQLWEVPFAYPIPVGSSASAVIKDAINTFEKESLLEGEFKTTVQNISQKLNLNMMRLELKKKDPPPPPPEGGNEIDAQYSLDQQLVLFLQKRIREKGEEDEDFRSQYGAIDVIQLVANLKYYMSDKNPRRENTTPIEMQMDNSEQFFNEAKITPKHGPLASFHELYLIPGWDDGLIDLIKNEFDVFPLIMIDLNRLTDQMLRLLIPNISDDEVKEFFVYRDNPQNPQFFQNLSNFRAYIVDQARIMDPDEFDDHFNKLKTQGMEFGGAPSLFKVTSVGTMNGNSTTIVAIISLPMAPKPPPPPPKPNEPPPKPPPDELLEPRIIDLHIQ